MTFCLLRDAVGLERAWAMAGFGAVGGMAVWLVYRWLVGVTDAIATPPIPCNDPANDFYVMTSML